MTDRPENTPSRNKRPVLAAFSMPGIYLLVLAFCGWLILMANMFGIAGASGWVFPVIRDIPGLAGSTLLLVVLGLTPLALKQLIAGKGKAGRQ